MGGFAFQLGGASFLSEGVPNRGIGFGGSMIGCIYVTLQM